MDRNITKGWIQQTCSDPTLVCDGGEFDRGCSPVAIFKGSSREARANARRMVALWNAFDGLPTSAIEAMVKARIA